MKRTYILLLALLLAGCSNSSNTLWQEQDIKGKTIGIDTGKMVVDVQMEQISDSLVQQLQSHLLDSLMNDLLKQTLTGYKELSDNNVKYVREAEEADLSIVVDSLIVKKGFTINITRPGPVYHIEIFTSENTGVSQQSVGSYSGTANFAEMVGGNKAFYQPDEKELENVDNQLATLDAALREALSKVFKDYLGLKNYM